MTFVISNFLLPLSEDFISNITIHCLFLVTFVGITLLFGAKIVVPYGKFSAKLCPVDILIDFRIMWVMQESLNLVLVAICIYISGITLPNFIFLLPFILHYIHRSFIFPFMKNAPAKYPLTICLLGSFHCISCGLCMGRHFTAVVDHTFQDMTSPFFIGGLILFAIGAYINISHDYYLIGLSKGKKKKKEYQLPQYGLFKYVFQANYFGELIEWTGYAVMNNFWIGGVAFVCVTCANLIPRAWESKKYYEKKFGVKRYALIPFVM